eukprot:scaffold8540_cov27-Tisochrysis_lutea.AAC.1
MRRLAAKLEMQKKEAPFQASWRQSPRMEGKGRRRRMLFINVNRKPILYTLRERGPLSTELDLEG